MSPAPRAIYCVSHAKQARPIRSLAVASQTPVCLACQGVLLPWPARAPAIAAPTANSNHRAARRHARRASAGATALAARRPSCHARLVATLMSPTLTTPMTAQRAHQGRRASPAQRRQSHVLRARSMRTRARRYAIVATWVRSKTKPGRQTASLVQAAICVSRARAHHSRVRAAHTPTNTCWRPSAS